MKRSSTHQMSLRIRPFFSPLIVPTFLPPIVPTFSPPIVPTFSPPIVPKFLPPIVQILNRSIHSLSTRSGSGERSSCRRGGRMLTSDETTRYSRQLILPEIGVSGQMKMKNGSVLIVGCGGLGCPAAQYLAGAGVGRIGVLDDDVVERSNLHRQILHREDRIGEKKTESVVASLKRLNSNVSFTQIDQRLSRENAMEIVKDFDLVLDATDNVQTRYLLSDVCVLNKKTLISGASLRFEGQLTVYNYDETTPCFRCLFPNPPPKETVTNCSDGGVLGVVPGIIGSLMALEAIKIVTGIGPSFAGQMLLFDGMSGSFRTIRIRSRRKECVSCGEKRTIGKDLVDYEDFLSTCPVSVTGETVRVLLPFERVSCAEYKQVLDSDTPHTLLDVRPRVEAEIVKLSHAVNIPLAELSTEDGFRRFQQVLEKNEGKDVFVMCRRGNASQKAVRMIKDRIKDRIKVGLRVGLRIVKEMSETLLEGSLRGRKRSIRRFRRINNRRVNNRRVIHTLGE